MKIHIVTDRLLMRDMMDEDAQGMFAMDSDAEVHKFLGNKPIATLQEAQKIIASIKQQYIDNGIGRWAVVEKESGDFIGWSGFRLITDVVNERTQYYDLGYRFLKKYWGKGYASETAFASLNHGFKELDFKEIVGIADVAHTASNTILKKVGLIKRNEFIYDGTLHNFYSLSKEEWRENLNK
ncbi:acetyltransferase, ribosomal protein N-acetylase [Aequorivita sublithincola DSM 14238]|uniref:Acetyltransferase, ribosomal protein N-acetylase n=1 Tax=Aequorivita sublithincola (strain DSM 14238 / LMG 21431 / ACAM 643 / 9-3) TaxID=746697 RepID=I3YW76_AEQSU|nr:GNAT family N-acetyltransferase [Aequorivita sublithincola]AFL81244.1 acetyltransferase, ribosomal protein N-acetylase [Aequorivita sublithincola DSM 14238]